MKAARLLVALAFLMPFAIQAQNFLSGGKVQGSFQVDGSYYQTDDKLGITEDDINGKVYGMNAFGKLTYTNGNFEAGMRYEAYLPPLSGYDTRFEGHGIPFWYANYKAGDFEVTLGNFYEQFGNGLVLRSYEEWTLGYDNSLRGVRVKYNPYKGITLKALTGTHRYFWDPYKDNNRGIVRALDGDFELNEIFGWEEAKTRVTLGGSFVSKFQKDPNVTFLKPQDQGYSLLYKLDMPQNVASWATRMNVNRGRVNFDVEYAHKAADPNAFNNYTFKDGEALMASVSYSQKGLGVYLAAKRLDNMSNKSMQNETRNFLDVGYLPTIAYQHTYTLATIYPYATQPNGEFGVQGQVVYTIPKKSTLGGKYGTTLEFNFSRVNAIEMNPIDAETPLMEKGTLGYESDFFAIGDQEYYQDINLMISHKFNKHFKGTAGYANLHYNIDVIEGHTGEPMVKGHLAIADMTYKLTRKKALHLELQTLFVEDDEAIEDDGDKGNWAFALLEYSMAPHWTISLMDQWNYETNHGEETHYYTGGFAYVKNTNRIQLTYGRQREGLVCVGGVCRYVPASKGLTLTITSNF